MRFGVKAGFLKGRNEQRGKGQKEYPKEGWKSQI